jgi:ABC-2 type transport system ATP-binding protein
MGTSAVSVRDLTKVYPVSPRWLRLLIRTSDRQAVTALDHVSFELEAGSICAVVGPNGAGKSTLFRVITGLTTPTAGSASVFGIESSRAPVELRRHIGFLPSEDRSLWMRHTCRENLWFHGRLQGMSGNHLERRIKETLEVVGLGHARNRVAFALSAGMNARLRLARAMLHRPKLMILDEPTGTLDPVGAHEMVRTIQDVVATEGMAVLMSSHRMEDVEELGDNVLLIGEGRVVYWGDLATLRERWEQPRLEMRFSTVESAAEIAEKLRTMPEVQVVTLEEDAVTVGTTLSMGTLLDAVDTSHLLEVHKSQLPLRELLAELLTAQKQGAGA